MFVQTAQPSELEVQMALSLSSDWLSSSWALHFSSCQGKRGELPPVYTWMSDTHTPPPASPPPPPHFPEVLPQAIQDNFRAVMGNFSGVIKILWVFVPLIFMGLWMAIKSEQAWGCRLPDGLDCVQDAGRGWAGADRCGQGMHFDLVPREDWCAWEFWWELSEGTLFQRDGQGYVNQHSVAWRPDQQHQEAAVASFEDLIPKGPRTGNHSEFLEWAQVAAWRRGHLAADIIA